MSTKKLLTDDCPDGICKTNEPNLPTCGETVNAAHTPLPGRRNDPSRRRGVFCPRPSRIGFGPASPTVGHARGIPDKNRRNQRVNLLIYTLLKPTFMKNFYCKCRLHLWLACLTAGIGLSACSDGDEGGGIRDTNPTNPSNSNRSILKPGR